MLESSSRKSAPEDSHQLIPQVPGHNAEEARTKELLQKVTINRKTKLSVANFSFPPFSIT